MISDSGLLLCSLAERLTIAGTGPEVCRKDEDSVVFEVAETWVSSGGRGRVADMPLSDTRLAYLQAHRTPRCQTGCAK